MNLYDMFPDAKENKRNFNQQKAEGETFWL